MNLMPVKLGQNGQQVLNTRYLAKDEIGRPKENASELFFRVAQAVAGAEKIYGASSQHIDELTLVFYEQMAQGLFMPNSPTLMNAGRKMGMLSACFVLPIEDSIDGIFSSIKDMALIQKAGGGTGFDFSRLRPKGDLVASSGGQTSGPLSFLRVFSDASHAIQQGAFRRGANMGIMRIDHPDILDFIRAKEDLSCLTNFNLSVAITDEFMQQLQINPDAVHQVINPRTKQQSELKDEQGEMVSVQQVFSMITLRAWQTGEPGLLFIDRINEYNPLKELGLIEATNPCGEQPLMAYESCNLGSVNLAAFVIDGQLQVESLKKTIHTAVRFLDNIIDINQYPIPQIEEQTKNNRKIGLGFMGFADALYALNIAYNSEEGVEFGAEIMNLLQTEAHAASSLLATEKGNFPNYSFSCYAKDNLPMRNACVSTIAPTGSISIICGCSGGIEPLFSLAFQRNILDGKKLWEVNPVFRQKSQEMGFYSAELIEEIASLGSLQGITETSAECNISEQDILEQAESSTKEHSSRRVEIPANIKRVFVTARDISPYWHIRMQAAFQKYCDASISKTINFSSGATVDEVEAAFFQAFQAHLKGITVYRDGCRSHQPMSLRHEEEPSVLKLKPQPHQIKSKNNIETQKSLTEYLPIVKPIPLPEILTALRIRQMTPFGNMHVNLSIDPQSERELEIFAHLGKGGDLASSDLEGMCRLASLYLRVGGHIEDIISQLDGIGSSLQVATKEGRIQSLADGLARALKKFLQAKKQGLKSLLQGNTNPTDLSSELKKSSSDDNLIESYKIKCPVCGLQLCFEEGCTKCYACGYSHC